MTDQLSGSTVVTSFVLISDLDEELDEELFAVFDPSFSGETAKIAPEGCIHYNRDFSPYEHGTLGLFKFASDDFLIGFEIYSEQFQIWGINEAGELHFHRDPDIGQTFPLDGDLNWKPDTWYYMFLAFIEPDEVHARVWEKELPSNMGELTTHFNAPAEGDGEWYYVAGNHNDTSGNMYVDKFISVYFE